VVSFDNPPPVLQITAECAGIRKGALDNMSMTIVMFCSYLLSVMSCCASISMWMHTVLLIDLFEHPVAHLWVRHSPPFFTL
jgi:hypothetical protein